MRESTETSGNLSEKKFFDFTHRITRVEGIALPKKKIVSFTVVHVVRNR